MAKMAQKRHVHCPIRHVDAFVLEWEDGNFSVKCCLLKACGDSCPYLKDPNYRRQFGRAPEYKHK